MSEEPKKIEVVSGNGEELEISDVATHLTIARPKGKNISDSKQEILIPQVKKKTENTKNKK